MEQSASLSEELEKVVLVEIEATDEGEEENVSDDSDYEEAEEAKTDEESEQDSESEDDLDDIFIKNWVKNAPSSKNSKDSDHFMSKNGKIKWFRSSDVEGGSSSSRMDIDSQYFGVQGCARNATSPLEAFLLFFDEDVLNIIVSCTNIHVRNISERYGRHRDCREITKDEMLSFLGLLLFSGVLRSSHTNFKDMWAQDGTGIEIFRMTMSYGRFVFILMCLRFDNCEIRRSAMKKDKLFPVKNVMNLLQRNFQRNFIPGHSVTIYEHIIPFRGRCPFKEFFSKELSKYGIKLSAVVDSRTSYYLMSEIYTGKHRRSQENPDQTPFAIVQRLVEPIKGSFRNVITGKWYTNIPLAKALQQEGLSMVGTCTKKDEDIPKEFRKIGRRGPIKTAMYGFTENLTLVSFVPKNRETQIFLSSRAIDRRISDEGFKPTVVATIESSQQRIEEINQTISSNGVGRRTKHWFLPVFFHLINMAVMNARIVLRENTRNENNPTGTDFLKQLSTSLVRKQLENRSLSTYIPKELRKRIRLRVDTPVEGAQSAVDGSSKGRCHMCPRRKDRKCSIRCQQCHHFVCKDHSQATCNECAEP